MTKLVIDDRRKDWQICTVCQHKVNPIANLCEEMHLPCGPSGCLPPIVRPEVHYEE